jgi:hypothetical protein
MPPQTALEALQFLRSVKSSRAEEFRDRSAQAFSLATVFHSPEDTAQLRKSALEPATESGDVETAA